MITLHNHMINFHYEGEPRSFSCDLCPGRTFPTKRTLKFHVDTQHNNVRFTCPHCDRAFYDKTNLDRHIDAKHSEETYACEVCGKVFHTKVYLRNHMYYHSEATFPCEDCGRVFATPKVRARHRYEKKCVTEEGRMRSSVKKVNGDRETLPVFETVSQIVGQEQIVQTSM